MLCSLFHLSHIRTDDFKQVYVCYVVCVYITQVSTQFSDVKGCDEAKDELEELVQFLKNPKAFTRLGGKLPHGVLLTGPQAPLPCPPPPLLPFPLLSLCFIRLLFLLLLGSVCLTSLSFFLHRVRANCLMSYHSPP